MTCVVEYVVLFTVSAITVLSLRSVSCYCLHDLTVSSYYTV